MMILPLAGTGIEKDGHVDGALAQLNELIARIELCSAHFMSGQYLAEEDRIEEAKASSATGDRGRGAGGRPARPCRNAGLPRILE